jgi:rfaE bifunctional protein nucleotidyltransferase chain/domain
MARSFDSRRKVLSLEGARRVARRARREGRRVVFTNGCFDLLHPGHVRYLARARAAGDLLVVGLNSDRSVKRLKGPGRPVQNEAARAEVLAALAAVDHVVVFDGPTPVELIRALRPHVLAKGADWAADAIVGSEEVLADGGRVLRVPLVAGQSTTRLVKRAGGRLGS